MTVSAWQWVRVRSSGTIPAVSSNCIGCEDCSGVNYTVLLVGISHISTLLYYLYFCYTNSMYNPKSVHRYDNKGWGAGSYRTCIEVSFDMMALWWKFDTTLSPQIIRKLLSAAEKKQVPNPLLPYRTLVHCFLIICRFKCRHSSIHALCTYFHFFSVYRLCCRGILGFILVVRP